MKKKLFIIIFILSVLGIIYSISNRNSYIIGENENVSHIVIEPIFEKDKDIIIIENQSDIDSLTKMLRKNKVVLAKNGFDSTFEYKLTIYLYNSNEIELLLPNRSNNLCFCFISDGGKKFHNYYYLPLEFSEWINKTVLLKRGGIWKN